jgi:hypothetical protein
MNSKNLFMFTKTLTMLLLATNIYSYSQFRDPTSGQDSSLNVVGAGKSISSEDSKFGGLYKSTGQRGGMPVPRSAQTNKSFAPQAATSQPIAAPAPAQGGGMSSQGISQILATNPQIKALVQQALQSGDSNKIQQILTLLQAFSGSSGGSAAPNGNAAAAVAGAPPSGLPAHCSAPKYNSMVNAIKGIPLSMEKNLATQSPFKVFLNYYSKKDENNYWEYKLVFRYEDYNSKKYVYAHFSIPRSVPDQVGIETYFITSNDKLMKSIVNDNTYVASETINCIDIKTVFNKNFGVNVQSSSFTSGPAQSSFGYNPSAGLNQAQPQQFGRNPMAPSMNPMMGGGGFNPFGGNSFAPQNPQQSFGYQPPSGQAASAGGTFLINSSN